ncbi:MAG: RNA-binding S4 domain-containing protein [Clostridia bacterium]|nr:RNA-binding S4 domain-containing protein [Clostridia bacterium]
MKIKLSVAPKQIAITTPFIRLCDFLKFAAAVESGGQAKEAIVTGRVQLNGEVCLMKGKKVVVGDVVKFEGEVYEVIGE